MRKLGLILDSSSAITELEARNKGHAFIPVQISINKKTYKSGVDIDDTKLYEAMKDKNVDLKTATACGEDIEKAFDDILTRFDKAVYIGLSAKMSGTNNAVKMVAETEKYKGKIFVYESEYSAPWLRAYLPCFEELLDRTDDINEIYEVLDLAKPYMIGMLTPGNIYWFYKGGRITKIQYMAGSLLKLLPILTIENGNMSKEKVEKVRGQTKAMNKIIENFKPIIENVKKLGMKFEIISIKSNIEQINTDFDKLISESYGVNQTDIIKDPISNEQIAHMGPGSFGMGIYVKLSELVRIKRN